MDNDELLVIIKQIHEDSVKKMENKFDEVKVIVENLENKIQIVAEGHDLLNKKFDALDMKVNALDSKVDTLDMKVNALDKKVSALDKKVNNNTTKIEGMEADLKVVMDYVIAVDTKLNEHEIILTKAK